MLKTPFVLGLLTLMACGGNNQADPDPQVQDPDPIDGPTAPPAYNLVINGSITDAVSPQARLAGPGTLAAATTVQAVTISGAVVASAPVEEGVYNLGLETVPADELLYIEALDAAGELLGSVVVELTEAAELAATPLDVESSVEAAVLDTLLGEGTTVGIWAEVRARIDAALAEAIAAEGDLDTALATVSTSIDASWEAQLDAFQAAGVDLDALNTANLDAATALSAALAAGDADALAAFETAITEAALAQGLTLDELNEANAIAAASIRAAVLAAGGSLEVSLETFRAATLAESAALQDAITAQIGALNAGAGTATTAAVELAFTDLETALQSATTIEEIELAVDTWRDTVFGAVEDELTTGLDFLDQLLALITGALDELQLALGELQTSIETIIDTATGSVDAGALADEIAAAYQAQQSQIAADLAALPADQADAMAAISMSFAGL